jgi:hypothetical protein
MRMITNQRGYQMRVFHHSAKLAATFPLQTPPPSLAGASGFRFVWFIAARENFYREFYFSARPIPVRVRCCSQCLHLEKYSQEEQSHSAQAHSPGESPHADGAPHHALSAPSNNDRCRTAITTVPGAPNHHGTHHRRWTQSVVASSW